MDRIKFKRRVPFRAISSQEREKGHRKRKENEDAGVRYRIGLRFTFFQYSSQHSGRGEVRCHCSKYCIHPLFRCDLRGNPVSENDEEKMGQAPATRPVRKSEKERSNLTSLGHWSKVTYNPSGRPTRELSYGPFVYWNWDVSKMFEAWNRWIEAWHLIIQWTATFVIDAQILALPFEAVDVKNYSEQWEREIREWGWKGGTGGYSPYRSVLLVS